MTTQNQAGFICDKILQLETAILHSHSNCLLKFPDSLVKTIQVDTVGCIWLAVKKPQQFLHEFDRSFHVGLNYYKKNMPFYLNILGLARLVLDPEELNQLSPSLQAAHNDDMLLISVRILQANYYENPPAVKHGTLQKLKQAVLAMFTGDSNYYHFNIDDKKNFA